MTSWVTVPEQVFAVVFHVPPTHASTQTGEGSSPLTAAV